MPTLPNRRFRLITREVSHCYAKKGTAPNMATEKKIFTVSQINEYIKGKIDSDSFLSSLWIKGEISNFVHHKTGHLYFTLKDENSLIRALMFSSSAAN